MDQSPTPILPLIPYAQASPDQLAKALFMAKEALGPSYAEFAWPQWYEAFAYFQPLLLVEPNRVSITADGLTAIARYFDTKYPSLALASPPSYAPPSLPPISEQASGSLLPTQPLVIKSTYSLRIDVLESLGRASFWLRMSKSALVNLAVEQLMATYPESKIPFR
jgi:hypothetical protein